MSQTMTVNRLFSAIVICLALNSCYFSVSKKNTRYVEYYNADKSSIEIKLEYDLDSTFCLTYRNGIYSEQTKGNFTIERSNLILNSFYTSDYYIAFIDTIELNQTIINVVDFENNEPLIASILHGNRKYSCNDNGQLNLPDSDFNENIEINVPGYKTVILKRDSILKKSSIIKMRRTNELILNNSIWKKKKKKIVTNSGLVLEFKTQAKAYILCE